MMFELNKTNSRLLCGEAEKDEIGIMVSNGSTGRIIILNKVEAMDLANELFRLSKNSTQQIDKSVACECGAIKTKTGHSHWCPMFGK